jgi:hypothetical protein
MPNQMIRIPLTYTRNEHISKPRILTKEALQFDPLYTGDILKAPEVKIIGASSHKSLFLNINGHEHRSGDTTKDKQSIEKAILLFYRSGADAVFLIDPRVTASRIKHSKSLVEEGIPGADDVFHPTTCTPGTLEENSMQCMGGVNIIISLKWAKL